MIGRLIKRIDVFQQRHALLGFPFAVVKKFGEDRGGHQATLLAYYGFFSLLPLLLVAVTVLGFVLQQNPDLQDRLIDSAISQFPIIGDQLKESLRSFRGSGIAFLVGLFLALWGGLGGLRAMQDAMNVVWDVPHRQRPAFHVKVVRALLLLALLGCFMLFSTAITAVGRIGAIEGFTRVFTLPASIALNVVVFAVAYRVLTVARLSWLDVLPGAVVAGAAWAGLQELGSFIVSNWIKNASALYGFFGIVIGLLSWLYLGARVALYSAEVNVVLKHHLWPRAVDVANLTNTDHKALARLARVEERVQGQQISVTFDDGQANHSANAEAESPGRRADGSALQ